jgi:hypothetical protein
VVLNALGHAPPVPVVILAYSIGYAANSLPIPGGIGVLDAGITGALVLYGVSPVHAAAAAIVYHAIAFWVPSLGGVLAYVRLRPRLLRPAVPEPAAATMATPVQPDSESLASKEAHHEPALSNPDTDLPRLGGDPHRRPRARPFQGALG